MKIKALAIAAILAAGLSSPAFAMTTGVTNTDTNSVIDGTLTTCENTDTKQWGYIAASAYANKSELNVSAQKQISIDGVAGSGSLNATASKSSTFSASLENSGSNSFQLTYFSVNDNLHTYFNGTQSQTQDSHTVSAFTNF